jgi:hypothetical protein
MLNSCTSFRISRRALAAAFSAWPCHHSSFAQRGTELVGQAVSPCAAMPWQVDLNQPSRIEIPPLFLPCSKTARRRLISP